MAAAMQASFGIRNLCIDKETMPKHEGLGLEALLYGNHVAGWLQESDEKTTTDDEAAQRAEVSTYCRSLPEILAV